MEYETKGCSGTHALAGGLFGIVIGSGGDDGDAVHDVAVANSNATNIDEAIVREQRLRRCESARTSPFLRLCSDLDVHLQSTANATFPAFQCAIQPTTTRSREGKVAESRIWRLLIV